MKALIFDTETTGLLLHPAAKLELQPHIIEIGAMLVEGSVVLREVNSLINPEVPIPPEATKINGITNDDVLGSPTFRAFALLELRELFAEADLLIAHNLPFDRGMVSVELKRFAVEGWRWPARSLCTVQEHVPLFGHRPKLTELYEHYVGEPLAQTHRALDDVRALWRCCVAAGVLDPGDDAK